MPTKARISGGWIRDHVPDHFFVVCGDRHWQYLSVDPTTGVQELSVGVASDFHAGATPGRDEKCIAFIG